MLNTIADMYITQGWGPKDSLADPVRWTRRDGNKEADYLVNEAMDTRSDFEYWATGISIDWKSARILAYIDGGSRSGEDISASAWLLKVVQTHQLQPAIIAAGSKFHPKAAAHSLAIETEAMQEAWYAIQQCEMKVNVTSLENRKTRLYSKRVKCTHFVEEVASTERH